MIQYRRAVERVLELSFRELGGFVPTVFMTVRCGGVDFLCVGVRRTEIGYLLQMVRKKKGG